MTKATAAIQALEHIVKTEPAGKVLTDAQSLESYGRDWTKKYLPQPLAIVFPKTLTQIQAIVHWANQHKIALVPSGGRTGLSGGAVAAHHEVVVAFDLMNQIANFNALDRTVACQAGVITEQLQNYAYDHGLLYPVDFASSGSSQIGGNIATNAGGIKVIRYGLTRDWVVGLKVVTGKGDVLELNKGLIKNATGYDLRHLFIGSEGTLGFIVEATIQLTRAPTKQQVLVLGVADFAAIMNILHTFQHALELTAFEFFSEKAVQLVTERGQVARPFSTAAPFYALLEIEAQTESTLEQIMNLFEHCVAQGWAIDGVLSQNDTQANNLWRLREDISETLSVFTPYKNDISVKVSYVPEFIQAIDSIVKQHYPDFEIVWFGHIGDGNLHLNILKPSALSKEEFFQRCETVNQWVFETVAKYEGSISAEHGVGLLKKPYLTYTRSTDEIAYMKAIKTVFDPNGIMNPGKIFD